MAPMTRRSQANTGVTKKVHRKRGAQAPTAKRQTSDSWELLDREGLNGHQHDESPDEDDDDQLELDGPMDVEGVINPLREMADRIGNEVESFARVVDEYLTDLPEADTPSARFESATTLVHEFGKITEGVVREWDATNAAKARKQTRKEWSELARLSGTSGAPEQNSERKAQQVKDLRDLQQEADLWALLHIMLELRPLQTEAKIHTKQNKQALENLGVAHRYTSEEDLWHRFELSNDVAIERKKVKQWLEQTARDQTAEIHDIVAELEQKAGRGKGLWTSGWMHTREKIKGEKRLRDWPDDVDSNPPKIRRTGDDDLLATRLDADAPARQDRVLEKQDAYFERAMWIACWEMLRRGVAWEDICAWCEERREGWRASCMGLTADVTEPGSSRAAWRQLCRLAAQSGCSSDHEAATFALLGGGEDSVKKVCRSLDDRIYAFYNSKLLGAFDSFVLSTLPDTKAFAHNKSKIDYSPVETREQADASTKALLARLSKEPATRAEMLQPLKVIQNFVLTHEVGSLLNTVGIMIGETAREQDAEGVIFFRSSQTVHPKEHAGEREVALNAQTLRMTAHMSIVYRALKELKGDELLEDDNIMVAYIQALRAAGKRDLIPMYASRLTDERAILVLGRVLQDVTEGDEQNRLLRLLQQYGLNVIAILIENVNLAFATAFPLAGRLKKPLQIVERTPETKLYPGQRIIAGFLPNELTQDDDKVVTALQWFQLCHGNWSWTFKTLTEALSRSLLHGNLACARFIIQTFPFEQVCLRKSFETIGTALNFADEVATNNAAAPNLSQDARLTRALMKRQSRTYYELELLVRALEALAQWREEEETYITIAPKPSSVPAGLRQAKAAVTEAMEPVLKGILLHPRDEQEAGDLNFLRALYVPEMVLAYNSVLHAAGNLITRDALLESMDLSVAIAGEATGNGLAEAFKAAGRLRELVDAFALTSKVMLVLKAEGKPWKARSKREGRELGVWEIGARDAVVEGE